MRETVPPGISTKTRRVVKKTKNHRSHQLQQPMISTERKGEPSGETQPRRCMAQRKKKPHGIPKGRQTKERSNSVASPTGVVMSGRRNSAKNSGKNPQEEKVGRKKGKSQRSDSRENGQDGHIRGAEGISRPRRIRVKTESGVWPLSKKHHGMPEKRRLQKRLRRNKQETKLGFTKACEHLP